MCASGPLKTASTRAQNPPSPQILRNFDSEFDIFYIPINYRDKYKKLWSVLIVKRILKIVNILSYVNEDRKYINYIKKNVKKLCECGNQIWRQSNMCQNCYSKSIRRVERPTMDDLIRDINDLGYVGTGKKYGVSDNAIRKWIKK